MLQVVWVSFMFDDTQEQGNGQGKGGVIPWKQIRKKLVFKNQRELAPGNISYMCNF